MKPLLRRLLLWVALPVLLVALAVWSWTPREPSWDGRSLSEWLKDLEPALMNHPSANDERNGAAARRAIQGMGTNCLPILLRRLESLDPSPVDKLLIEVEDQLGKQSVTIPWTRTKTRMDLRLSTSADAVKALGHQAVPAFPEFQQWLSSTNGIKVHIAGWLLGGIPPKGTAVLIAASTNRTFPNRAAIVVALNRISTEQPEALTALLAMADDTDAFVRTQVGHFLPSNPHEPAVIWPVFNRLLADPDSSVRRTVVVGLGRFTGDLHPGEPAITALTT
ncbi:MAG: hypothetical protein ABMA26_27535, partial [Limisphaerales bacterium]